MPISIKVNSGFSQAALAFGRLARSFEDKPLLPTTTSDIVDLVEVQLQLGVKDWSKGVKFDYEIKFDGDTTIITVSTENPVYNWVQFGTRPHQITIRNAKALVFSTGYTAKTKALTIPSNPGGPFGPTRHAITVNHPGTKPRRFDIPIAKVLGKSLPKLVDKSLQKRVDASFGDVVFK